MSLISKKLFPVKDKDKEELKKLKDKDLTDAELRKAVKLLIKVLTER